jgi:hypothetical protein
MPRLIDELRAKTCRLKMPWFVREDKVDEWQATARRLQRMLDNPEMPVLLIDNVAEYYYFQSEQEYWSLDRDFPNLAPPYQSWWCEHRIMDIHSKECGDSDIKSMVPHGRVGMLFVAIDRERDTVKAEHLPDSRWVLWCEVYMDYGLHRGVTAEGPSGSTFFCIDGEGRLVDRPWMQSWADDSERSADAMRSYMTLFNPALLAVSFLHCKNVTLIDNKPDAPLAKKYKLRHGIAPCSWKTLVIEPLKSILRNEGRSGEVGVQKALHICRGHFRDYREGRGLFGKYHQLVWMPSIVRGSKGEKAPPREIEIKI